MKKKSFAKINLSLDVLRRNADGYHELEMVMAPIDLFDTIDITPSPEMEFISNKPFLPSDERNSIIKAIHLIKAQYQITDNFRIRLMKNIPSQGGLGGGSSNAATTIRMLNEMYQLNMPEKIQGDIALQCGSDVPFCLFGKPAFVSGIGEKIQAIDINTDFWMFLAKPKRGVSTKKAFALMDLSKISHPNCHQVVDALKNNDYQRFIKAAGNSLEYAAQQTGLELSGIKNELLDFGFDAVIMSGSGSTVLAFTQDETLVQKAVSRFFLKYSIVKKTKIVKDTKLLEDIV